jgi:hypothetical protein
MELTIMVSNCNRRIKVLSITLDKRTKEFLDKYAEMHAINRSAAIRIILNDFFLDKDGE